MRYIRQQIFKEIGKKGQQRLRKSAVAIVGIGALGTVSAQLLARAGVGKLILIDRDIVELSNLQRQSLFEESDVGKAKSAQAKEHLSKINKEVEAVSIIDDLNYRNIERFFDEKGKISLLLDCTDNLETRFLINDFSIKHNAPFIFSSAVGSKGYVFNIVPKETPCLKCFLKEAKHLDTCENFGVLNTITNLIASIQANEAIKILLGKGYEKGLLFIDIWKNELSRITVTKNKNCACCIKGEFEHLSGKKSQRMIKLCGSNIYQLKAKAIDKMQFSSLKGRLKKIGKVIDFGYCIGFDNKITVFEDGRALIKAKGEKEAKSVYSKIVGD